MARTEQHDLSQPKKIVRYFIGYFCLVAFFGVVILIVHASMEVKRLGYESAKRISTKIDLIDELRQVENRIGELESYNRISALIDTHLPALGPPQHPAIELHVRGLEERDGVPESPDLPKPDNSILNTARKHWKETKQTIQKWLIDLVE